jgi:signal peptidase II
MLSPLSRARLTGLFTAGLIVILDQWSKAAIIAAAKSGAVPAKIFPFFNLVMVRNSGISFGMFGHMHEWGTRLLTAALVLVALCLSLWLLRAGDILLTLALGLIVGGAAGNIADRLRFGAVTDFLDFHLGGIHFWSFNVADSAIFMGVVILLLISIVKPAT